MKERPILFTPENAQKVHEGVKVQTRRTNGLDEVNNCKHWDYPQMTRPGIATFLDSTQANPYNNALDVKCPYGVPGDALWIREAHQFDPPDDGTWCYMAFMGCKGAPLDDIPPRFRKPEHCLYRGKWDGTPLIWRPSLHMPRWACRTVVELTEIRVERVSDINGPDCLAEGIRKRSGVNDGVPLEGDIWAQAKADFKLLWASINGQDSWAQNPFVWVLTFRKVDA